MQEIVILAPDRNHQIISNLSDIKCANCIKNLQESIKTEQLNKAVIVENNLCIK